MKLVRKADMPQKGASQAFVGAEHGGVGLSAYLFAGPPGRSIGRHWHPYVEVHFVEAGRGVWHVGDERFEAGTGDIVVLEPGDVHGVSVLGDQPLRVIGVHLSPSFVQTEGEQAAGTSAEGFGRAPAFSDYSQPCTNPKPA